MTVTMLVGHAAQSASELDRPVGGGLAVCIIADVTPVRVFLAARQHALLLKRWSLSESHLERAGSGAPAAVTFLPFGEILFLQPRTAGLQHTLNRPPTLNCPSSTPQTLQEGRARLGWFLVLVRGVSEVSGGPRPGGLAAAWRSPPVVSSAVLRPASEC